MPLSTEELIARIQDSTHGGYLILEGAYTGDADIPALVQALQGTSVHTLDLCCNYIGGEGASSLAQALKGTLVTTVMIEFTHPELSKTLKENLNAKKGNMIALGQLSAKGTFPPDVVNLIASFLPEACGINHKAAIATIDASHEFSRNKVIHNAAAQVIQRAWARHCMFREPISTDSEHSISATNLDQHN
jgi:hypothetical protein